MCGVGETIWGEMDGWMDGWQVLRAVGLGWVTVVCSTESNIDAGVIVQKWINEHKEYNAK